MRETGSGVSRELGMLRVVQNRERGKQNMVQGLYYRQAAGLTECGADR